MINMQQTNFFEEEMYHMFDLKPIKNKIHYFNNTLSYPDELINFIDEVDSNEKSHDMIGEWFEWEGFRKKIIWSYNMDKVSDDEKINSKCKYIYNSLVMAREFCLENYFKNNPIRRDGYIFHDDSVIFYMDDSDSNVKDFNRYIGDDWEIAVVTFLNDDYEGGEIYFDKIDVSVKPSSASLLIIPNTDDFSYTINPIKGGSRSVSVMTISKNKDQSNPNCYMSV